MAINIKELFNADADNIRVDKINYNFDQILANGGGPIGVKGNQGTTGNTGTKGQKGELGGDGDKGEKGNDGSSANLWDSDTLAITAGDLDVLRPFNNPSDDLRTRIILGQDTSAGNTNPPNTTPREPAGLLNLVLPPENNDDTTSQIIFINDETGDPREFKMATSYEVGTGSTFTLSALAPVSGEETNLNILMPNKIEVNAIDVEIDASNSVEIKSSDNIKINGVNRVDIISAQLVTIGDLNNTVQVDIKAEQFVDIDSGEYIYMDAQDSIELTASSILLNATTKNDLTAPLNELTANGAGNLIQASGAGYVNIINATTGTGGANTIRVGGVDKFMTNSNINTSTQNIFFSDPDGDHDGNTDETIDPTEVSSGDGIQFKTGAVASGGPAIGLTDPGYYAAPNSGTASTPKFRTLSDYFFEDNLVDPLTAQRRTNAADGSLSVEPTGNTFNTLPLGSAGSGSVVSYVKVGNSINVNGRFSCRTHVNWKDYDIDGNFDNNYFVLRFNKTFPYLNNGSSPVHVNVAIDTQFGSDLDVATGPGTAIVYFGFVGVIYPNSNVIHFYKNGVRYVSSPPSTAGNPISNIPLSPRDLSLGASLSEDQNLQILFSFTMPTLWNSYNREYEEGINGVGESIMAPGGVPSATEIQLFNNVPNSSNPQLAPLTSWQSDLYNAQAGTYTTTFYSNMGDGAGLTITNDASWISNLTFTKTAGPFTVTNNTNSFLNPSTNYSIWTLSVTLLESTASSSREANLTVVPVDDTNWGLPSGITTFKIRQDDGGD